MSVDQFDRETMARWYATRHLKTDPGIRDVYYLPTNAPDREIRFIEINESIADRHEDAIEPIDFGVDTGSSTSHKLMILDVTPAQWDKITKSELQLPPGWSLSGKVRISRN